MASIIKTDNIQNTCGSNIINQCGTTVTLGASGDSVVLGAGVTATGFGRSGGVDYCTTVKTSPFTAANGSGYFVNTSCGAVTVTLPATPSAGAIIALKDYGNTWQTNNVTLCNNGSKINGVCATASLSTQGQSVTLIYVDSTKGWQDINDSTSSVTGSAFIIATGGTITTCGDYKIHTFTSDGTFCVSAANVPANANVDYLVIAGGGGSPTGDYSGGAGAGGYRESYNPCTSGTYTASPLATPTSLPVSVQGYPITVGGGGATSVPCGTASAGSASIFSTITSTGGGYGGTIPQAAPQVGGSGGSGGGGGYTVHAITCGGSGNTPPVSPPQGNPGGQGDALPSATGASGGGGGGAGAAGCGAPSTTIAGNGGNGSGTQINTSPSVGTPGPSAPLRYFSGGGGGNAYGPSPSTGGFGGGGAGGGGASVGTAGTVNTGGGAGAKSTAGGSGIVIIRYKYQ
jgi:hypothetical protein